jgi:mRNA-degrading endonuclease RelE of RelBE toxin-antitoxin system
MEVELLEQAKNDLLKMDNSVFIIFTKHLEKIAEIPFQRHLKHGLPFYVEEVGQGRIIFTIEDDTIFIERCFTKHKDYENWYRSFMRLRDSF